MKSSCQVLLFFAAASASALRPNLRGVRRSVFYATSTRKRTQKPKAPPQTQTTDDIPIYTASPTTERVAPHLVNAAMYEAELEEEEAARAKDDLCRTMFARFARGQELLRRNHGAPVLHGPDTLDLFVGDLAAGGVAPDVIELLQRMREGAFLNGAGGTQGGRLQLSLACLNKEDEFQTHVKEAFFREGDVHFELFPSTTKSIESFCSLLAAEASLRERPIKVLVPADAHYAWTNVLAKYESHPYLKSMYLSMDDDRILKETRFRPGDLVVAVYTLANTVSGRATNVEWFQDVLAYCEGEGASTAHFVDAALAGLCVAKDTLDLRADEDVAEILDGAIGLVQSGFKDFGLSSMLFLDDAEFECCGRRDESGLQSAVAGGAHALIRYAPVTSIPESPTLAFLLYAREYTAFRKSCFVELCAKLRKAIPEDMDYELRPLFPLLHLEFKDQAVTESLTDALMATYSLITIDAEPNVVRLWPTPTNHDVADAIAAFFD